MTIIKNTVIVAAVLSTTIGLCSLIDTAWQKSDIRDIKANITHMQRIGDAPSCEYSMKIEDPLYRYYNTEVFCHGKDVDALPDYLSDEDADKLSRQ